MEPLATTHDAAVQIADTSIVRVHQHGACIAGNKQQEMVAGPRQSPLLNSSGGIATPHDVARRSRI
jgi:hypothetical protein